MFYSGTEENIEIPDSYNGQTITAIGSMAFNNVGAAGLMTMDFRDENNPIFKVFFWEEPSQELKDEMAENGVTMTTYEDIINTGYRYDEIDMSGGPIIIPIGSDGGGTKSRLKTVDMSKMEHLKEVYPAAFNSEGNGGNIESVIFPTNGTLISIGNGAFGNNKIRTLNLPQGLKNIESDAFYENQLSETLTIPSSVTSIGKRAFSGNSDGSKNKISSLVFENNSNLQTIGNSAFSFNQLSGTLTIPSSITSIGDGAFYGNKINTLNLGSGLTSLGSNAFSKNYNNTTSSYTLQEININMTESTWNSRNLPTSNWYDGNITPTYKSE